MESTRKIRPVFASIVIPVAFIIALCIFLFLMGSPSNFEDGNPANHPLPGNYLGIIYKGGYIVPILMTLLLLTITFTIERMITLGRAKGKGNLAAFVRNLHHSIGDNNIEGAVNECNTQQGSVANVMTSMLHKYKELNDKPGLDKDQKILKLQIEMEEATELELPALEKNLVILATIASISTLMGLLGTVLGMIKAFAALAKAGAPDSIALANGISEALINTAFGIGTSAIAIIFYNYFTTQIDQLSYRIQESGLSLIQAFNASLESKKN